MNLTSLFDLLYEMDDEHVPEVLAVDDTDAKPLVLRVESVCTNGGALQLDLTDAKGLSVAELQRYLAVECFSERLGDPTVLSFDPSSRRLSDLVATASGLVTQEAADCALACWRAERPRRKGGRR